MSTGHDLLVTECLHPGSFVTDITTYVMLLFRTENYSICSVVELIQRLQSTCEVHKKIEARSYRQARDCGVKRHDGRCWFISAHDVSLVCRICELLQRPNEGI